MEITYENFENGILEVHVSGEAPDEKAFAIWRGILLRSNEKNAQGVLYISDVKEVLQPSGARKLIELFQLSNILALAYVRNVLPDPNRVASLTLISKYAMEIGTLMQTFYTREEALDWLMEIIGPIA